MKKSPPDVRLGFSSQRPSEGEVEILARRIHAASCGAAFPFVRAWAGALPIEAGMLRDTCSGLLDATISGSLLLTNVEDMPAVVQDGLLDLLAELQSARAPSAPVRLIAGTTVALYDRIAAGTFSERLFYRLNIIHLVVKNGVIRPERAHAKKARVVQRGTGDAGHTDEHGGGAVAGAASRGAEGCSLEQRVL
jgi:sigma54-dependent transcription regulator